MSDLVSQIAWFHIAEQQKVNPETSRKCAETLAEIIKEENNNGRI